MGQEALFPDRLEEHYGQLAHHYIESAQDEALTKAVEYAVKAGERNMVLPAPPRCCNWLKSLTIRSLLAMHSDDV